MTLRRAINKGGTIEAQCPHGGTCQYRQTSQGKIMHLSCTAFSGTVENESGLFARCGLKLKGGR